jgi:hypothetical protein
LLTRMEGVWMFWMVVMSLLLDEGPSC